MTKKEFEKRFDEIALKCLTIKMNGYLGDRYRYGICCSLDRAFREYTGEEYYGKSVYPFLVDEFEKLFKPKQNQCYIGYWMGDLYDENINEARQNALLLFKNYCLDSQIYRGL